MIEVHCYYSLSSPWAYFAGPRLGDIVRRHHARLLLKPFAFAAVVPKTGGVPLRTRPEPRRRVAPRERIGACRSRRVQAEAAADRPGRDALLAQGL